MIRRRTRSPFATVATLALAGVLAVGGFAATGSPASAEDLIVKFDQSQLIRLPRPVAELIIGNPSIADVTIQSGNLLVITGKSYGITNIIALDSDRNVIQDQRILVRRDETSVVNVTRGTARQTLACVPQCNPTLTLGDDIKEIQLYKQAAEAKLSFSERGNSESNNSGQRE